MLIKEIKPNNIYLGDCLDLMPNIPDKSIQLTIADIPYDAVTQRGVERAKYAGQLRKFDKENADILTFDLREFLDEVTRVTKGSIYIFCGIEQISEIYSYYKHEQSKEFMSRLCVWKKANPSPVNGQHMYLSGAEYIVFAKRRKTYFNSHCQSNVWDFPCGRSKIHPTEKPTNILEMMILNSSQEGDLVLDPVMGSGSTIVASIKTNRKYIGIEKDPKYYEVAKKRIQDHLDSKL